MIYIYEILRIFFQVLSGVYYMAKVTDIKVVRRHEIQKPWKSVRSDESDAGLFMCILQQPIHTNSNMIQ